MQSRKYLALTMAAIAMSAVALPALAQSSNGAKQPAHYYVINLGDPGGGTSAAASTINNIGWVAGTAYQSDNTTQHAELWLGIPLDLGTLGGPNSGIAWTYKNTTGEVAGISETADLNPLGEDWSCGLANFLPPDQHICYGFLWQGGVMTALPPLPGGLDSYGSSVNNRGQVAGWAENGIHDSTCAAPQVLQFEATIWGPKIGQQTALTPLAPDPDSAATAINDSGDVVGISGLCSNAVGGTSAEHAVLWHNGSPINLGNFDGGVAWNTPTAINSKSQVVGFANQAGTQGTDVPNPIAFYWTRGQKIQPIAPIGTDSNSWAWGMNDLGQVVGQSYGTTTARAFIYQGGTAYDLNDLVSNQTSLDLLLANDINDRGEIVGYATDTTTNNTVAFLAIPQGGSDNSAIVSHNRAQFSRPVSADFAQYLPGYARYAFMKLK